MAQMIIKFKNKTDYDNVKKDAHRHEKNISEYIRWLIDKQRKEDEWL